MPRTGSSVAPQVPVGGCFLVLLLLGGRLFQLILAFHARPCPPFSESFVLHPQQRSHAATAGRVHGQRPHSSKNSRLRVVHTDHEQGHPPPQRSIVAHCAG